MIVLLHWATILLWCVFIAFAMQIADGRTRLAYLRHQIKCAKGAVNGT